MHGAKLNTVKFLSEFNSRTNLDELYISMIDDAYNLGGLRYEILGYVQGTSMYNGYDWRIMLCEHGFEVIVYKYSSCDKFTIILIPGDFRGDLWYYEWNKFKENVGSIDDESFHVVISNILHPLTTTNRIDGMSLKEAIEMCYTFYDVEE